MDKDEGRLGFSLNLPKTLSSKKKKKHQASLALLSPSASAPAHARAFAAQTLRSKSSVRERKGAGGALSRLSRADLASLAPALLSAAAAEKAPSSAAAEPV